MNKCNETIKKIKTYINQNFKGQVLENKQQMVELLSFKLNFAINHINSL